MLRTGDAGFWMLTARVIPPRRRKRRSRTESVLGHRQPVRGRRHFSACADFSPPGSQPIVSYLNICPRGRANCKPNHYTCSKHTQSGLLPNGAPSGAGNLPPSPFAPHRLPLIESRSRGLLRRPDNDAGCSRNARCGNPTIPTYLLPQLPIRPMPSRGLLPDLQSFPVMRLDHGRLDCPDGACPDTADLITAIQTTPCLGFVRQTRLSALRIIGSELEVDLFEAYTLDVLAALDSKPNLKAERPVHHLG